MTIVCDLDGVIWLADDPIAGAAEAVAAFRAAGHRVLFVSNNSFARVADVEAKLARFEIPAHGDVVTSAQAAATLFEPGERVLLCGGPGIGEELADRGAIVVDDIDHDAETVDAVVVGFHRTFTWDRMRIAATAIRNGARFVATNDDATYPTPMGPVPGCGSIVAGVATASGRKPVIAGKPYGPMVDLVRSIIENGPADSGPMGDVVMVGDRADTDGRFARALGCQFALVMSGVTRPADLPVDPTPDLVADDVGHLAAMLLH